jgi:hypothetical protein
MKLVEGQFFRHYGMQCLCTGYDEHNRVFTGKYLHDYCDMVVYYASDSISAQRAKNVHVPIGGEMVTITRQNDEFFTAGDMYELCEFTEPLRSILEAIMKRQLIEQRRSNAEPK